jgi:hypothetical protein
MYGGVFASISKFLEVTNVGTLTLQIVNHLLSAGAIIYVKTNIPQTMFAFECSNPVWGRTTNPYNEDYTCGGSSGVKLPFWRWMALQQESVVTSGGVYASRRRTVGYTL